MKLLIQIARILTGLVFAFSGFVKGIDPMGTAFKLGDYFSAFRFGFLDDFPSHCCSASLNLLRV